jgi:uncharacterized protein (TIRG00374 family)
MIAPTAIVRSPTDIGRLFGFSLLALVGGVLATVGQRTLSGFVGDVVDALAGVPAEVLTPIVLVCQVVLLCLALGAPVVLVVRGQARTAGVGALAIVIAWVSVFVVAIFLPESAPSASLAVESIRSVRLSGFPPSTVIAGYAAAAVVVSSELSPRWSRWIWAFLVVLTVLRFATSSRLPLDVVLAIGLGGAIGSLMMVIFGRRIAPVSLHAVADALAVGRADVALLADPAWPEWSLVIRPATGGPWIARTMGLHEFLSDNLRRGYRRARLKDVGDDDSYSSPRRALAVEAMMSLLAAAQGVRTPAVRAVEQVSADEYVIAIDHVAGRSVDSLADEELTPEVLADVWAQIAGLRRARIAHRDLRLSRFLLDPQGRIWIRDFAFGEAAASAGALDLDVAELLCGTYARVGATRAVESAHRVLGADALVSALVRLVPVAMTRPTRAAIKATPQGLEPLIAEVRRVTGAGEPEFVAVERVKPRTLVVGALLGVAIYVVLPQLTSLPSMLETIGEADWQYVPAVVLGVVATYVGAALGLIGGTPGRLPFGQTMLLGLASSFVTLVAPSGVGRVGLSVRFLQKRGHTTSVAVSASAAREVSSVAIHLMLIVVFALWAGQSDAIESGFDFLPSAGTVLAIGGVLLGLVGIAAAIPRVRKSFRDKAIPAIREAATAMVQVASSPLKMLNLVVGSALVPLGFVTCLYFSVLAFGGDLTFTAVGLVFLTVGALAAAAPTPGGIGAVEAVLLAALTGLGLPAPSALAAVFLYRIITFWLPLAPGAVVFQVMTRRKII